MTCTSARSVILDLLRGASTEADRLRLEQHLGGCAACRRERARWGLVETVRDLPVRTLGAPARARVLRRLVAEAASPGAPQLAPGPAPPLRRLTLAVAAAAAAAAMVVAAARLAPTPSSAGHGVVDDGVVVAAGQLLGGERAGSVRIAGAQVRYAARSSLRLADPRRVDLLDGEVDVEVTPGGPGRFRVYAPRFIVEVLGTRFVVSGDGVRTLHGTVRVLDRQERELRVVRAGESWQAGPAQTAVASSVGRDAPASAPGSAAPFAPPAAPVPVRGAEPASLAAKDAAPLVPGSPSAAPRSRGAAALLSEAARALAEGRTGDARRSVRAALAAAPLPREHARADLALADAERIDRQTARALDAYRLVAERWSHLPEGEQALFLIAQINAERGDAAGARAAFAEYLSRYPSGRFRELAESRLGTLRAAP